VGWLWFALPEGEADAAIATAVATRADGTSHYFAAWAAGDEPPHERAAHVDERLTDPAGRRREVS
jgi:hypothetical protein